MRPWLVALLALGLALPLSGCSGSSDTTADLPAVDPETGLPTATGLPVARLDYGLDFAATGELVTEDVFPLAQTCNFHAPPGCIERLVDLTTFLPSGVPVDVTLEVTFPGGATSFRMETYLTSEATSYLFTNTSSDVGRWTWTGRVVPRGTVAAAVISGGPMELPATDTPYTLTATFAWDNSTVPAYLPVALRLAPGAGFHAMDQNGKDAEFLLYGPDDKLVEANGKGTYVLPNGSAAGDYVVRPTEDLHLMAPGGGELRPLAVRYEDTGVVAVPNGSEQSFTMGGSGRPINAGVHIFPAGNLPVMEANSIHYELAAPDGRVLLEDDACTPFCLGGFNFNNAAGFEAGPYEPGTYTLTLSSQTANDVSAFAWLAYFDRETA